MKKLLLIVSLVSSALFSCSNEPLDDSMVGDSIIGNWKLTEVNIYLPNGFDLNNDGVRSTNLLDEIDCANKEVLTFDKNGVMQSNLTFNPDVDIYMLDESKQEYSFSVQCDIEGAIGYATSFTKEGETIIYNGRTALQVGDKLYMVFKSAIGVFNSDGSKLLNMEDLNLVYSRQ